MDKCSPLVCWKDINAGGLHVPGVMFIFLCARTLIYAMIMSYLREKCMWVTCPHQEKGNARVECICSRSTLGRTNGHTRYAVQVVA